MAEKKVVIVGAGPGGLAASILLAKAGVQVTVLERLGHVGGRTSTFSANGFTFDTGPTFFLYPQVLRDIFAAAGSDLDRELELIRLDPQYRLIFGGGGELLATPDLDRMQGRGHSPVSARWAGLPEVLRSESEETGGLCANSLVAILGLEGSFPP